MATLMGRRTTYTEKIATDLCNLLSMGATNADACSAIGIPERTFYTWLRDRPDFDDRYLKAKASSRIKSIDVIRKSDDWRAHAWLLERQDPKNWGKTTEPDGAELERLFQEFMNNLEEDDGHSEVSGADRGSAVGVPLLPATTGP